ncbi:MAG: SMP-30/gluconolactonase/LRE family protein, partial [Gammaproteobacteria bacterium]
MPSSRSITCIALLSISCAAAAQQPASAFKRGNALQSWQDPGYEALIATCASPPPPFRIGGGGSPDAGPPPEPEVPEVDGIAGVIETGASWRAVWSWEGNNADGLIDGGDGTLLFANNDASNVMRLDPATGLAQIIFADANTGGAVSRSANGALFLLTRGLNSNIQMLEPERRVFADTFNDEPLDCLGGVLNDLVAARNGGVYFTISGRGLFFADARGNVAEYGTELAGANGIILSPDERTLYVTNGPVVVAFDVQADGTLTGEREFGRLRGGGSGDGSAVDQQGRVFVATGASADVF